jgi:hypothetical protein
MVLEKTLILVTQFVVLEGSFTFGQNNFVCQFPGLHPDGADIAFLCLQGIHSLTKKSTDNP